MTTMRVRAQTGFTLLELLVAIALFSLLAGVLYGALRLAVRTADAGDRSAREADQLRIASGFITRYVGRAMPVTLANGGSRRLLFQGAARRIVFVTTLPALAGHAGPCEIVLEGRGLRREGRLLLSYRPLDINRASGFGRGAYTTRVLVDGLLDLHFDYYGRRGRDDELAWGAEWREPLFPPELVRVRLRTDDGGAWPDIVVHVHANGSRVLHRRTVATSAESSVVRGFLARAESVP